MLSLLSIFGYLAVGAIFVCVMGLIEQTRDKLRTPSLATIVVAWLLWPVYATFLAIVLLGVAVNQRRHPRKFKTFREGS